MLDFARNIFVFLADHLLIVLVWAVGLAGLVTYAIHKGRHG